MKNRTRYTLECCVDSVESAVNAKKGGADRLELCSNLIIGGTTPTLALYKQIRETVDIRIHVLIRPRFGDFLYSPQEMNIMEKEIDMFREAGAEGIVIGCLSPDGSLDTAQMKRLIAHACGNHPDSCFRGSTDDSTSDNGGMHITLHRAFDMCLDPFRTLEEARELGIHTILTSGQGSSCLKGIDLLGQLRERSGAVDIMAGAGVNEEAVRTLLQHTGLTAFHMSGKKILESQMQFRNSNVSMGLSGMSEYEIWQTDASEVLAVRTLLDNFNAS